MKNIVSAVNTLNALAALVILSITMVLSIVFVGVNGELGNNVNIIATVFSFGALVTTAFFTIRKVTSVN